MKRGLSSLLTAAILVLLLYSHVLCQNTVKQCGTPVHGIVLCLSPFEQGMATLEIRNIGDEDAVLDLGIMLANGARQYANAITLTMRDAAGQEYQGVLAEPAIVSGRLDPFIISLPKGANIRLPLQMSKYAMSTGGQLTDPPTPDNTKQSRFRHSSPENPSAARKQTLM
jgi:hypothetical protein